VNRRFDVALVVVLACDELPVLRNVLTVGDVSGMDAGLMVEFCLCDKYGGVQFDACELVDLAWRDRELEREHEWHRPLLPEAPCGTA
jgi:hypothetical protein